MTNEIFKFIHWKFNVSKARELIHDKKLKPRIVDFDITDWAKSILGLKLGDRSYRPVSVLVKIDYKHVLSLSEERLKEPGILVTTNMGAVVIDGNHRLARLFMDSRTFMKMYVLSESQCKKHKIMV